MPAPSMGPAAPSAASFGPAAQNIAAAGAELLLPIAAVAIGVKLLESIYREHGGKPPGERALDALVLGLALAA